MTEQHRYTRLAVKTAAFMLAVLTLTAGLLGAGGTAAVLALAGEEGTAEAAAEATARYILRHYNPWEIAYSCRRGTSPVPYLPERVYCTVTDGNGTQLYNNHAGQSTLAQVSTVYWFDENGGGYYSYDEGDGWVDNEITGAETTITVTLYLASDQPADSWNGKLLRFTAGWHQRWAAILLGSVLCLLTFIALTVYLLWAAGRRPGEAAPRCSAVDRIPFDVYTALVAVLAVLGIVLLIDALEGSSLLVAIACLAVCGLAGICLLLAYCMSLAVRIKTHTLWHNTLIGRLLRLLGSALRSIPLVWKCALTMVGLTLVELFVLAMGETGVSLIFLTVERAVVIPLALLFAIGLRRLQQATREIAGGNLNCTINTDYMTSEQRRTAADLTHIGDGLSAAVEGRLKSERFKTELITNVSHDIKTPLTSIINYVDLLEKAHPEGEQVQEYLAVLERQSARLKKLIEDLVEASKASTGNLPVHPAPCGLGVLLEQVVGEYEEKAKAASLELVLTLPEQPVTVLADGRHLWRVLDNLMNNVCKYSQPGTRVYLELAQTEACARITFRNISRSPLNISSEELMERFVRGDSSRNTEGSGLGLSIARSLTELQGGQLLLAVDGDLFKVMLLFPLSKQEEMP